MKRFTIASLMFLLFTLFLAAETKMPDLAFTNGAYSYFTMFNSFITLDESGNKISVPESSFRLDDTHIPWDAISEKAYLVWSGSTSLTPDNTVHIKFVSNDGRTTLEQDVEGVVGENSLGFETVERESDKVYTFRTDISDFFKKIFYEGRSLGKFDGDSYLGQYTVSGLECGTNSDVCDWSIIFVYVSEKVSAKRVFFYRNFGEMKDEISFDIGGFNLPLDPAIRMTFSASGGKPSDKIENIKEEGIYLKAESDDNLYLLTDVCNPVMSGNGSDIWNSNSSVLDFDGDQNSCRMGAAGTGVNLYFDVDTFLLSRENDAALDKYLVMDSQKLSFRVASKNHPVISNYVILSNDCKTISYEPERELDSLSCSFKKDSFCAERPFYYTIRIVSQSYNSCEISYITNPSIKLPLPENVDYIKGTAEIRMDGEDWKSVPDKENGGSPFQEEYIFAEKWNRNYAVFLRFKAVPKKGTETIAVTGYFNSEKDGQAYILNMGQPFVLNLDEECPGADTCPEPLVSDRGCKENSDCLDNHICSNGGCLHPFYAEQSDADSDIDSSVGDADSLVSDIDSAPQKSEKSTDSGCGCSLL